MLLNVTTLKQHTQLLPLTSWTAWAATLRPWCPLFPAKVEVLVDLTTLISPALPTINSFLGAALNQV